MNVSKPEPSTSRRINLSGMRLALGVFTGCAALLSGGFLLARHNAHVEPNPADSRHASVAATVSDGQSDSLESVLGAPGNSRSSRDNRLDASSKADNHRKAEALLSALAITPEDVKDAAVSAPADYELQMEAAAYYLSFGNYNSAEQYLRNALRLRPDSQTAWIAMADSESLGGQYQQSYTHYQQALQRWPGNALAYRGLGQLLVREKKLPEALNILQEGLKKNPNSFDIRLALGNLDLVYHRYEAAEEALIPAVHSRPMDADAHFLLGEAYQGDLHIKAALQEELAATRADPRMAEAWELAGNYLVTLQRYREARPLLENAIKLAPQDATALLALGNSYYRDHSLPDGLQKSIVVYRQAEALRPDDRNVLISLSSALIDSANPDDHQAAVLLLERLLRNRPADREGTYRLAEAYRLTGRPDKATLALNRYQSLMASSGRNTGRNHSGSSPTSSPPSSGR